MWLPVYLYLAVNIVRALPSNNANSEGDVYKIGPKYEDPWNRSDVAIAVATNEFPSDFLFGVGTAAFQIEGAWNVSGKGESIWDHLTHNRPELISDQSNGDVATDSYHKYAEDIQLVRQLGANAYRISLSWTRILPNGFANRVNPDGIRYYNDVINEMLKYGIQPMVTLYHWDLPQRLQELGGWTNPYIVDWFEAYARVAFNAFGDRVKLWVTLNEPMVFCGLGYDGTPFAPYLYQTGIGDYLCGHHALLAHARVYRLYDEEFRSTQKGKIGLTEVLNWYKPAKGTSIADIAATESAYQFYYLWTTHPVYSEKGDYPRMMKARVAAKSQAQGFPTSRLPQFTPQQIEDLKGSADFLGLNFYMAKGIAFRSYDGVSRLDDASVMAVVMNDWAESIAGIKNTPWGLYLGLNRINGDFNFPDIYILENGYPDSGETRDSERTTYLHDHLQAILLSMQEGTNIKGYFAWALMDNFEWADGYSSRLGLFNVNFTDPNRSRTPKLSCKMITDVYRTRRIPPLSSYL